MNSQPHAPEAVGCFALFSIMKSLKSGQFHALVTTSKSLYQTVKAFQLIGDDRGLLDAQQKLARLRRERPLRPRPCQLRRQRNVNGNTAGSGGTSAKNGAGEHRAFPQRRPPNPGGRYVNGWGRAKRRNPTSIIGPKENPNAVPVGAALGFFAICVTLGPPAAQRRDVSSPAAWC